VRSLKIRKYNPAAAGQKGNIMSRIINNYTTTDEIKQRIGIEDIASEDTALIRRGNKLWGRCPFHEEKTASFCITPDKSMFYCFGCHAKGDIFSYVMKREGLSFPDAKSLLAAKAGLSVDRRALQRSREVQQRREQERAIAHELERAVNAEINRLIGIEKWIHTIIETIYTVDRLDSPLVIWALKNRPRISDLLDKLQMATPDQQLEILPEGRCFEWPPPHIWKSQKIC